MAAIYQNPTTERVKDVANQYLRHTRMAGPDNIIALCPFHQDSSPSFAMNIHNGLYICYACGEKGNLRSFLTKMGMTSDQIQHSYGKTLEDLKRNAPPPKDPTKFDVVMEPTRHIPEDLLGLFYVNDAELVETARQVLELDLSLEILRRFEVGIDKKHQRVTFPLRDLRGNLVGISGRAMHEDQAERYKVYRAEYRDWDLPPYDTDKNHLLWNAHRVYPETMRISKPTTKTLVEGFKAAMWLTQAGVPHVVALMTKTMSGHQRQILERMGGPYTLMLDNDEPGVEGTINVSRELIGTCGVLKIVEYEEEQPTAVPLEELLELVQSATDYNEMLLS